MATLKSNVLTTLDEAKVFLKIPSAELSLDDLVITMINLASDRIERFCNRKFIKQTHTEFKDGNRVKRILLHQWPVNSVTTLHIDSRRVFGSSTLVDSSDYDLDFDEKGEGIGVVLFDQIFPRGTRNVKIVYDAGYIDPATSEISLPGDVRGACLFLVQYYFQHQQQADIHQASKTKGDETVTINLDMPEFVQSMLVDYQRCEIVGDDQALRNF